MRYKDFLAVCREIAGKNQGVQISAPAFATLCSQIAQKQHSTKTYSAKYYMNKEAGLGPAPGRELLEIAAQAAGMEFEDCIQIPNLPTLSPTKTEALRRYLRALDDPDKELEAIDAATVLAKHVRSKRPKTGGRNRKTQE